MTDLTTDNLSEIAKKLTIAGQVYSDTLSELASHPSGINTLAQAMTKQINVERKLFSSTRNILKELNKIDMSPGMRSLIDTNSKLTEIANKLVIPESTLLNIFENQKHIQNRLKKISVDKNVAEAFVRIDTTRILAAALTAQVKLVNIEKISLGKIVGIDSALSKKFSTNLGKLTNSYQSLINMATASKSLAQYLPLITTYPPVDYYREIKLLDNITIERDSENSVEKLIDREVGGSLPSVDDLLEDLNPSLCRLLEGARQSLSADNPDQVRYVTISLRELFTHVLHELAPDKDIREWTTNSEYFHDNRPTRRARLLFICRNINFDPLTRFVEYDVKAALCFVDSLSSGTHVVESKLTPLQLSSMVARMEALLVFLLQIRNFK